MSKILFISTVIFTIILLFAAYIFLSNLRKTPSQDMPLSPFTTQVPTQAITPQGPTAEADVTLLRENIPLLEQLISRLPVSTEEYDIEYLESTNTFAITIKVSPYEENKIRAEKWFLDNGLNRIEGLNIIYNNYRWVE